jgi:tRNA (guanosine-2'-O-)-methyltransferase
MKGDGPRYRQGDPPPANELLLDVRRERIDQVVGLRSRTLTVVLDGLEDSFNMAAVLRTCEAMGLQELHVIPRPGVPFVPHVKVTQGCEKWVDLILHESFAACREHLKSRGFSIWASAPQVGSSSLFAVQFGAKMALVFGNERFGVSTEALASADGVFWIPMRGFTRSLNISVAVGVSISCAIHWREQHLGRLGDLTAEEARALTERFYQLAVKQQSRIYSSVAKRNDDETR